MSQKIRMISSRGTRSYVANDSEKNLWIGNKNTVKRISRNPSGQKLTSMRGTNSFWLTDQLKHNLSNPKKTTLLVQRGTKKITTLLNPSLSDRRPRKNPSVDDLTCNTCKNKISFDVCRFLIMHDKNNGPRFFSFHFFSPCWNIEDFFKKYPDLTLDRAGFSVPENTRMSENAIKNLQSNSSFWFDSEYD